MKFQTPLLYNNKITWIINWNKFIILLKTINWLDNLLTKWTICYEIENFNGWDVIFKTI